MTAIHRGERARQIIEDDLFREAWEGLEAGAIDRIAKCSVTDTQQLQALTMSLQTVRAVRARMEMWIAYGEEEAKRLAREQEHVPLLSRFRRA